jgi:HK97 family phage major capsid protein
MAKKQLTRSEIDGLLGKKLKRALPLSRAEMKIDEEARTVEMSFSSDEPIEHWFGRLILNHAPAAIRLGRLREGGPLLLDHDSTKQIGVHEEVHTDGHKLRGTVRFSRGPLGEEIFQDVRDGIRRNASVGVLVYDLKLVREDDDGPVYQSDDWEPIENSIVAIPRDTSVGVGRSMDDDDERAAQDAAERRSEACACEGAGCGACNPPAGEERADDSETVAGEERAAENTTTEARSNTVEENEKEIIEFGRMYGQEELARSMALEGKSIEEVRAAIKTARAKTPAAATPAEDPSAVAARSGSASAVQIARGGRLKSFRGADAHKLAYSFGMFMLAGPMARAVSGDLLKRAKDFCSEQGIRLSRAHSESDNESGGFLVPTEFENVMIDLREQYGVFRRHANVVPMASDAKQRPRRRGGLTAYPIGAKSNRRITESKKAWDLVELFARKWGVLAKYEEELSEDAVISMADDLASEISYAFSICEDQAGFLGDGSGDYHGIVGVIPKLVGLHAAPANIAGIVVASGNSWEEITRGDFLKLIGRLPQYADTPNTRFFCSKTFWSEVMVRIILEAGGVTAAEVEGARVKTFMGYPVEISQVLPKSEANSQVPVVLGDLAKGAMFGDRRGITVKLTDSNDTDFEEDLMSIKGTERFDINVHDVGNASADATKREPGPIVALRTAAA